MKHFLTTAQNAAGFIAAISGEPLLDYERSIVMFIYRSIPSREFSINKLIAQIDEDPALKSLSKKIKGSKLYNDNSNVFTGSKDIFEFTVAVENIMNEIKAEAKSITKFHEAKNNARNWMVIILISFVFVAGLSYYRYYLKNKFPPMTRYYDTTTDIVNGNIVEHRINQSRIEGNKIIDGEEIWVNGKHAGTISYDVSNQSEFKSKDKTHSFSLRYSNGLKSHIVIRFNASENKQFKTHRIFAKFFRFKEVNGERVVSSSFVIKLHEGISTNPELQVSETGEGYIFDGKFSIKSEDTGYLYTFRAKLEKDFSLISFSGDRKSREEGRVTFEIDKVEGLPDGSVQDFVSLT